MKPALAIHGGAGTILGSQMTPALEAEYRSGLEVALKAGWDILSNGGSSLDAVEAAVAEGALLRLLRRLLIAKDPDQKWGDLQRTYYKPEGHHLWLCPHHLAAYK